MSNSLQGSAARVDLAAYRRFFAEEIQTAANIRSAAVVEALAAVPRERFLPPGPWTIRSEADFGGGPRQTPDADPRHVYHNIAVAIDAARMLFNGAPSVVAMAMRPAAQVCFRMPPICCGFSVSAP